MTKERIDMGSITRPGIRERQTPPEGVPFLPFQVPTDRAVPDFLPIGGEVLVRQTSSSHGSDGYITAVPMELSKNRKRLRDKLVSAVDRFCFYEAITEDNADTLLLTYGVTTRSARAVCRELRSEGKSVSLLALKTLWPVPEALIREKTESVKRVLVLEMNLGQYVREMERILPNKKVDFLGQMDGRLITPHQIRERLNHG
jgi:2-oxoglutarate ferredoxin oxidoreductase subunit alpha